MIMLVATVLLLLPFVFAHSLGDGDLKSLRRRAQSPVMCCSFNFKNCGTNKKCSMTANQCTLCGGSYIDPSSRLTCAARWTVCMESTICCGNAICITGAGGSKRCDLDIVENDDDESLASSATIAILTSPPTAKPTFVMTLKPSIRNDVVAEASFPAHSVATTDPTMMTTKVVTVVLTPGPATTVIIVPTVSLTSSPTMAATPTPTANPTLSPTTLTPTSSPTIAATLSLTPNPTSSPTMAVTLSPTANTTLNPTVAATETPTSGPTTAITLTPTVNPTPSPTMATTFIPTANPTRDPTMVTTLTPTANPTSSPTIAATETPTSSLTMAPTQSPTANPTLRPTMTATLIETNDDDESALLPSNSISPPSSMKTSTTQILSPIANSSLNPGSLVNPAPEPITTPSPIFKTPKNTSTSTSTSTSTAKALLDAARSKIISIIKANPPMAPKFLRLGFHDCVGGCDGCVDLLNLDNRGLDLPIASLERVVTEFAQNDVTRADMWVLAALTAVEETQGSERIDFPMHWYGRPTCDVLHSKCLNAQGMSVECSTTRGPHRMLPSPDLDTHAMLEYFKTNFELSADEMVALMGGHSIGKVDRVNSGFVGNGWDLSPELMTSGYYAELVGGSSADDTMSNLVNDAPDWTRLEVNNEDLQEFPNRHQWINTNTLMLNIDIALVRDYKGRTSVSGGVNCTFVGATACPVAVDTIRQMSRYKNDNLLWLRDFRDVINHVFLFPRDADKAPDCNDKELCFIGDHFNVLNKF